MTLWLLKTGRPHVFYYYAVRYGVPFSVLLRYFRTRAVSQDFPFGDQVSSSCDGTGPGESVPYR